MRAVSLVEMSGVASAPVDAPASISGAANAAAAAARLTARGISTGRAIAAARSTARALFRSRVAVAMRAAVAVVLGKSSALLIAAVTLAIELPVYAAAFLVLSAIHFIKWATALCADSIQRESSRLAAAQCRYGSYPATASPAMTTYHPSESSANIATYCAAAADSILSHGRAAEAPRTSSQRSAKMALCTALKPS